VELARSENELINTLSHLEIAVAIGKIKLNNK
jgi:hypothetical protein